MNLLYFYQLYYIDCYFFDRFEGIAVQEATYLKEWCEECTKQYARLYCGFCIQLFCQKCFDLCHQPINELTQHPHEQLDVFGKSMVRPIAEGDKSKVVIDNSFYLPEYEFEESDYKAKAKVDITQENSLSISKNYKASKETKNIFNGDVFEVGERVLFMDPETNLEAYGRIVSELDMRHGAVAPTLIRGDGSVLYYIVEKIDLLSAVGSIDKLLKVIAEKPPPPEYPLLYDIQYIPFRDNKLVAKELDKRIAAAKAVQELGPRKHLKDEVQNTRIGPETASTRFIEAMAGEHSGLTPPSTPRKSRINDLFFDPDELIPSSPSGKKSPTKVKKDISDIANSPSSAISDLEVIGSPDNTVKSQNTFTSHNTIKLPEMESSLKTTFLQSPRVSRDRLLINAISGLPSGVDTAKYNVHRAVKLFVFSDRELCKPEDRSKLLQSEKFQYIKNILERVFFKVFLELQRHHFHIWFNNMEYLRERQRFILCRKIQCQFRIYLAKIKVDKIRNQKEEMIKGKWLAVHQQFCYCTKETPYSVTMDNKLFFETATDANRYAAFQRKMVMKVLKAVDLKRQDTLRLYIRHWRNSIDDFLENSLKFGHFQMEVIDNENDTHLLTSKEEQDRIVKLHLKLKSEGINSIGANLDDYENIATMPLLKVRRNIENTVIPPYHPSVGISLPPLPELYTPKSAGERLTISDERRLDTLGFRGVTEGPTDNSCWIIPGRLAMGRLPYGMATKKGKSMAILNLLFAGLNSFCSLMEENEETNLEKQLGINPIPTYFKSAIAGARMTITTAIHDAEAIIDENTEIVNNLPVFNERDPRYEKIKRERLRAQARIKLASESLIRTRKQLKNIPKENDASWFRQPFNMHNVPSIHEMNIILWDLEQKLSSGANIFMYSSDGHGRTGYICGLLIGRLYGLTYNEVLYRIQACHDCMKEEFGKKLHITCPQNPDQRESLKLILEYTNRVYKGSTFRTHSDPETYGDEIVRPARGTGKGIDGPKADEPLVTRLNKPVHFNFDIERDTLKPPQSQKGRPPGDDEELNIDELYDTKNIGQAIDIIKQPKLIVLKQSKDATSIPSLRIKNSIKKYM